MRALIESLKHMAHSQTGASRNRGREIEMNKTATVREADQLIGRFSVETAPNDFIRRLVAEAVQSGEATATDPEGVEVTAVAREDE